MKIGFIGLGNMGSGIASCIRRAGYDLTVWNRTAAKTDTLVAMGAKRAASPREAASGADIVITCLMDDKSVLNILGGDSGILAAMKPCAIHLCVTTISPHCASELDALHRKHDTRYVSGPVVGRPDAAAQGQLATYLAGDADALEIVKPICASYARIVVGVSEKPSVANSLKLCINYAAIGTIELIGEVYAFAEKSEVDVKHVNHFFQMAFAHPALKMYAEKALRRDFTEEVGFAMSAGLKDVRLMLDCSKEIGMSLEIGQIVERKMIVASGNDLKDADWSAICEVTRRESGL